MLLTLEVRWFYPGTMPPGVLEWFGRDGVEPVPPATRIDQYLQVQETDGLGIKVRDGRLEVKQRHRGWVQVSCDPSVAGRAEYWRKWSFSLEATRDQLSQLLLPSTAWIAVHKTRWLRTYQLLDGSVVAVSTGRWPEQGCNWEVTQVSVGGRAVWTVGLEAFGSAPSLRRSLLSVAGRMRGIGSPPVLADECSFGYPRLLIMVQQGNWGRAFSE